MSESKLDPAFLRQQIVGVDSTFETPFGERLMVYCDYTASGRCLRFVESYLQSLQRVYANTHTEDDITGRSMSQLLHEAEEAIKKSVNAGPGGRIIACGTGATGAIDKLQQIIGVALAPATRQNINRIVDESDIDGDSFHSAIEKGQPIRMRFPGGNRLRRPWKFAWMPAGKSIWNTLNNCCRTRRIRIDCASVHSQRRPTLRVCERMFVKWQPCYTNTMRSRVLISQPAHPTSKSI
jgi:hypothetical protein